MVPSVAGYSFGAFSPDTSKTTSGNTSFRIGLLNPGDQALNVSFESRGLENGRVALPESIVLPPSEVSSTPSENAVSVSPGTYIEPRWIEFYVVTEDYSDTGFSVQAEAERTVVTLEEDVVPRTVQVREFRYSLSYPEQRFPESEEREETSPELFSFGSDDPEQNKSAESNQTVIFGGENKTDRQVSDSLVPTAVLATASLLSLFYLWRSL